ncbi:hypothetical protein [Fructilactobacillus fructivorans]|uniref:Uncharacterized protein n=1 Tax=Fructilactobacillus fructivorans TaxID=1614 RepID=A0A0C1PML2_9LACO|nr:hypothetical protein [Fructilactobacillus fructivorans]KID41161.1 hypothetical protein LfDm3_1307 [Fructilactobacillus fructivorans]KRK57497.1 hypothetical protein FC73_GL001043 [Fructilactobacillus fructivorans]KRN12353.1 hypothetical protein IV37_GL001127 [Fructilactobacillus fructivorans]KRN39907.1 hypothetical protein IV51_GL000489 [Fructilactobacillus fructivorans]KRN42391.1 hypothetical protein IV48_GL000349 [Fructilactobacillus fructivorans]
MSEKKMIKKLDDIKDYEDKMADLVSAILTDQPWEQTDEVRNVYFLDVSDFGKDLQDVLDQMNVLRDQYDETLHSYLGVPFIPYVPLSKLTDAAFKTLVDVDPTDNITKTKKNSVFVDSRVIDSKDGKHISLDLQFNEQ